MPVANGGLGIRRATDIALTHTVYSSFISFHFSVSSCRFYGVRLLAFLSSVAGSQSLIHRLVPHNLHDSGTNDPTFTAALTEWQSRTKSAPVQPSFSTSQKVWDAPLVKVQEMKVLSAAPVQAGKALNCGCCTSLRGILERASLFITLHTT